MLVTELHSSGICFRNGKLERAEKQSLAFSSVHYRPQPSDTGTTPRANAGRREGSSQLGSDHESKAPVQFKVKRRQCVQRQGGANGFAQRRDQPGQWQEGG